MDKQKIRLMAALWVLAAACAGILAAGPAESHGIAGKRFFPATLATDDPFVADELSLPTIESRKMPASGDEPATRETGFSVDVSKRVTDNLGIGFGATYKLLQLEGGQTQHGFDNLAASVKYKFYQSDEHETIRVQTRRSRVVQHADAGAVLRQGLRRPARHDEAAAPARGDRARRRGHANRLGHDLGPR